MLNLGLDRLAVLNFVSATDAWIMRITDGDLKLQMLIPRVEIDANLSLLGKQKQ